ncbi:MAG: DEAD/DEAH box helicase [Erysipelotrichaceae bacterium]|nr:DEAD/DEAH box helicase [Erysipelotrichaceae bacterium]
MNSNQYSNQIYKCPVCGNTDPRYLGVRGGSFYCRKCITFIGGEETGDIAYPKSAYYKLDYDLTEDQMRLSEKLIDNYKNNKNTLVHAVCGSGKTEIVLKVIKYAIECGETVGFAIPRRDVAIELYNRFKDIFKRNKVICLYGGHTEDTKGDLVVLTTHQLYRYDKYFDLLIVDEIDAFPFNGNQVLEAFFRRSIRRNYIMMSATPTDNALSFHKENGGEIEELFSRYHMHPLPVPRLIVRKGVFIHIELIDVLRKFLKKTKPVFIFVPTIDMCESLYSFLKLFFKRGLCLHSKVGDRQNKLQEFKEGKYRYIVTTAILERGVTFPDLQVIIFKADHTLYNSHALIQIAGRVGRKKEHPDGEVIFLANESNEEIENAIAEIKRANKSLQNMSKIF